MTKLINDDPIMAKRDWSGIFDDFYHFATNTNLTALQSTGDWYALCTNSGSVAVADGYTNGQVKIYPSDAENSEADNDETYMYSVYETFKFLDGQPMVFECRVKPVFNTTTGVHNIMAGFIDAVAADSIQDDGAGPDASYSGAVFFLKDGDTTWWCESSIAASQTTVDSGVTATNNTWTTLRIEVLEKTSTTQEIHFFIDDVEVGWDTTTSPGNKIAQTVTISSATDMHAMIGAKNGAANDSFWVLADYAGAFQKR